MALSSQDYLEIEPRSGMYWHVHHDTLLEWCWNADRRQEYIIRCKPPEEYSRRMMLFQPVKGKLPEEVVEAAKAYAEATRKLLDEITIRPAALFRPGYYLDVEASPQRLDLCVAFDSALERYKFSLMDHADALEQLHFEECIALHHCPWNGKTIFPVTCTVDEAAPVAGFSGNHGYIY